MMTEAQLQIIELKKQAGVANAAIVQGGDPGPALREVARIANALLPKEKVATKAEAKVRTRKKKEE